MATVSSTSFSFHNFTVHWLCLLPFFSCFVTVTPVLIVTLRNHHSHNAKEHRIPVLQYPNQSHCDLFSGSWVRADEGDDGYTLYRSSSCAAVDPLFNCEKYGRQDTEYLKYRWQPTNCQLPRFNGVEFVTKMRGKSIMFVGDSLSRNQWESLICMISADVPATSSTQMNKGDVLSIFRFLEYGVTLSYYKAQYLVDIDFAEGKRVLKLDEIRGNANAWTGVDVLSFNTGHWWSHTGNIQGWDYMELGGTLFQDMDRAVALEHGLRTWAKWVDTNVDISRTRLFFLGISPTHFYSNEWNSGSASQSKSCYGETVPMTGSYMNFPGTFPDQIKVVEEVISEMNKPPFLLDITMMSAARKDAHPSIYNGDITPEQRADPTHSAADCSHWCLPGLPDSWNQLFYTALFF